jgi:hypothetical protein
MNYTMSPHTQVFMTFLSSLISEWKQVTQFHTLIRINKWSNENEETVRTVHTNGKPVMD